MSAGKFWNWAKKQKSEMYLIHVRQARAELNNMVESQEKSEKPISAKDRALMKQIEEFINSGRAVDPCDGEGSCHRSVSKPCW